MPQGEPARAQSVRTRAQGVHCSLSTIPPSSLPRLPLGFRFEWTATPLSVLAPPTCPRGLNHLPLSCALLPRRSLPALDRFFLHRGNSSPPVARAESPGADRCSIVLGTGTRRQAFTFLIGSPWAFAPSLIRCGCQVPARRVRDGSGQHLASLLQEGRENANIDAGLGFIWRISVKSNSGGMVPQVSTNRLRQPFRQEPPARAQRVP
jgi:hypothetical protein